MIPRLNFLTLVRLACTSKAIAAVALADIAVELSDLQLKGKDFSDRQRVFASRLLAAVRLARPGPARLRVSASSKDLDLSGLFPALEGASQLELISVTSPNTTGASTSFAEEIAGFAFDAADIARLYAAHSKLARAVLNVKASSFVPACLASPEDVAAGAGICSLPGAELSLIGSEIPASLLADGLRKACTGGGGFRSICLRLTVDDAAIEAAASSSTAGGAGAALSGLAAALQQSRAEHFSLAVVGETAGRKAVMEQVWAALTGGWALKTLRLQDVRRGDIACAALLGAAAAAAGQPAAEGGAQPPPSGVGGTPGSPAALEIWQWADPNDRGDTRPPDAHARALLPFLHGTRCLAVDAPSAFMAALLPPAPPAHSSFGERLESLAVNLESCGKVVVRVLPSLHGLQELQMGLGTDKDADFYEFDKLLRAALVSGAPLSVLRFGPGVYVTGFDDDKAVAEAAAQLIASGRLTCLEMALFLSDEISSFLSPIFAALQSSDDACGVRPGSRLEISADVQMWGFLERGIRLVCEDPQAPATASSGSSRGGGGGRCARLTLLEMSGYEQDDEFEGENDMYGVCLDLIIAFVRQQPLVREAVFCTWLVPGLQEAADGPFMRMLAAWEDRKEPLRLELWGSGHLVKALAGVEDEDDGLSEEDRPYRMEGETGSVDWMVTTARWEEEEGE